MTLLLFAGLALVALAGLLVIRTLTFADTRRRAALAHISSYGFDSAPRPTTARRTPSELATAVATTVGERLVRRAGAEREGQLRSVLDSAGFYRTGVATFLGYRALAAGTLPSLLLLVGGISPRTILGAVFFGAAGWVLPKFLLEK